jgi:hypothetical protein
MAPAESYMQQLLLKLKQLHEENRQVVVSSSSSSTLPVEAWPSDADIKRVIQQQQQQSAKNPVKPSATGTVQKLQQQQKVEHNNNQKEEQGQQKEQRPSQKQKQLREAREWLAQQQASQHSSQASTTAPVCVAGTFCTRWQVILSRHLFCLCPLMPLQQDGLPCAAGSFCPYFRRVDANDGPGVAPPPKHSQQAKISFNSLSWCQFVQDEKQQQQQQQAGASLNRSKKKYTCSVCKASFKAHQYAQHVSVDCCCTRSHAPRLVCAAGKMLIACSRRAVIQVVVSSVHAEQSVIMIIIMVMIMLIVLIVLMVLMVLMPSSRHFSTSLKLPTR